MTGISQEEVALALIGSAYLIAVGIYAWWLTHSADALLRAIKKREPAGLRDELGRLPQ